LQDSDNNPAALQPHTNASSTDKTDHAVSHLLHHREYFAALEDHVIAARLQCRELPSSLDFMDGGGFGTLFSRRRKQTPSCLNIAAAISRSDSGKSSVSSSAWSVIQSVNQTEEGGAVITEEIVAGNATEEEFIVRQKISRVGMKRNSFWPQIRLMRGIFGVSIHSNPDSPGLAPDAEVCGVITCRGGENMTMNLSEDGKSVCSLSSSAEIFLAIELKSRGNDMARKDDLARSPQELKLDCQKRLLRALENGYEKSRELHANKFDNVMSGMDFSLRDREGNDGYEACDGRVLSVDTSTNLHCGTKESAIPAQTDSLSPSLLRRQFQFSRYLLFSSAADSVPNLQFWADGPNSAWSGDYHLNVNLQMMYWGSGPAGLRVTHRPLGPFIQSLAQVGRNAAQRMYNCSGDAWVAHGNTDHSLDGGLRADAYWVFCSTCGLWAALQLFENLLFSPFDDAQAIVNTLSVLRGASHFLKQFTFFDPLSGSLQTGPTTSPENSYLVFRNTSTIPVVRNVSKTLSRIVQLVQNASAVTDAEGARNTTDSSNSSVIVNKTITFTTWELTIENQTFPASSWTQHLSFTPSFDASLIRQLANSFPLLTRWAREALDESLYSDSIRGNDEILANDLVKLARALPNVANPVIGKSKTVLEYPTPMGSCGRHDEFSYEALSETATPQCFAGNGGNDNTPFLVTESPDTGHRHFSGMHWLYPNTFLPLRDGEELIDASLKTLDRKRKAGGGHTGWSASWLASLSARLRDGEGAWTSIARLILHYTTKNGLDLHPPLAGLPKDSYTTGSSVPMPPKDCDTCFHEKDRTAQGLSFDSSKGRGLETLRSDKFQLDGHGGLIAAVSELLLMSHIPGTFLVLPGVSSLPLSLGGGMVRGIKARGDASISVSWTGQGKSIAVTSLDILFGSEHPWLFGSGWNELDGYYSHPKADTEPNDGHPIAPAASVRIYVPSRDNSHGNEGQVQVQHQFQLQTSPCAKQLDETEFSAALGRKPSTLPPQLISGMTVIYLSVENFPCRVELT